MGRCRAWGPEEHGHGLRHTFGHHLQHETRGATFDRLAAKIGEHHWLMLKALLTASNRTLNAIEIAAAGYASFVSANVHLGKVARTIAGDLGYRPDWRAGGTTRWTTMLATGADPHLSEDDGLWRWTLRPEVADCLLGRNLGGSAG